MESFESRTPETISQFESRKKDHIHLSLDQRNQAEGLAGLERIELIHEALPELNFNEIDTVTEIFGLRLQPLMVSSMTAGHAEAVNLNLRLAEACERRNWLMGVGSQRRELTDPMAQAEWRAIRKRASRAKLLGNLGLSQVIQTPTGKVQEMVDNLEATAMIVHTNPLQEALQPEGTPEFKGGLKALERLVNELDVPVILKETGCGFSQATLLKVNDLGLFAVDLSGLGGTHWGRIEGERAPHDSIQKAAAQTFKFWGISTVTCIESALKVKPSFEIWASGGIRSGLDAAKLLAMGVQCVGFAKPILEAAMDSETALDHRMELIEFELKTALFCTGAATVKELQETKRWQWRQM